MAYVGFQEGGGIDYFASATQGDKLIVKITVTDNSFKTADNAASINLEGFGASETTPWPDEPPRNAARTEAILEFPDNQPNDFYGFSFTAHDWAGHETTYDGYATNKERVTTKYGETTLNGDKFAVDTTKPTVRVSISAPLEADPFDENGDGETEDYYKADSVTAHLVVTDNNFDKTTAINSTGKATGWKDDNGDGTWEADVSYDQSEYGVIEKLSFDAIDIPGSLTVDDDIKNAHTAEYAYATKNGTGKAGEVDAPNASTGFVVDNVKPKLTVSLTGEASSDTDANGNISLRYYGKKQDAVVATVTLTDKHAAPNETKYFNLKVL